MALEHRQDALEVVLALVFAGGGDVRGDHGDAHRERQRQAARVAELVLGAGERALLASMGEQRQIQRHQFAVERPDRFVRRIDGHDVGNPLEEQGTVGVCLPQPLDGIVPVGIDAGPEAEIVVARHLSGDECVGHVDLRRLAVQLAGRVDHAVERQHHGLAYALRGGYLGADSGDHQAVAVGFDLCLGHAEGA